MNRRDSLKWGVAGAWSVVAGRTAWAVEDAFEGDPFESLAWPGLRREFFGLQPLQFDPRVEVLGPAFAEDPMNVPISVSIAALEGVEQVTVIVDRNPIRKVIEYFPVVAVTSLAFRFKLEQASPVRAAARTRDGVWHVGGAWVESSGGGCTVSGASRKDGSWVQTLGAVSARMFSSSPARGVAPGVSRLRLMVMHPMDTGLVAGVPAFYLNRLSVRDGDDRELMRVHPYEPISENPVFSFDIAGVPSEGLSIVGTDNNGNRIKSRIE